MCAVFVTSLETAEHIQLFFVIVASMKAFVHIVILAATSLDHAEQ